MRGATQRNVLDDLLFGTTPLPQPQAPAQPQEAPRATHDSAVAAPSRSAQDRSTEDVFSILDSLISPSPSQTQPQQQQHHHQQQPPPRAPHSLSSSRQPPQQQRPPQQRQQRLQYEEQQEIHQQQHSQQVQQGGVRPRAEPPRQQGDSRGPAQRTIPKQQRIQQQQQQQQQQTEEDDGNDSASGAGEGENEGDGGSDSDKPRFTRPAPVPKRQHQQQQVKPAKAAAAKSDSDDDENDSGGPDSSTSSSSEEAVRGGTMSQYDRALREQERIIAELRVGPPPAPRRLPSYYDRYERHPPRSYWDDVPAASEGRKKKHSRHSTSRKREEELPSQPRKKKSGKSKQNYEADKPETSSSQIPTQNREVEATTVAKETEELDDGNTIQWERTGAGEQRPPKKSSKRSDKSVTTVEDLYELGAERAIQNNQMIHFLTTPSLTPLSTVSTPSSRPSVNSLAHATNTPTPSPSYIYSAAATVGSAAASVTTSTWSLLSGSVSGIFGWGGSTTSTPNQPSKAKEMPHASYQDLPTVDPDEQNLALFLDDNDLQPQSNQHQQAGEECDSGEESRDREEVPEEVLTAMQDKYVQMCAPEKYRRFIGAVPATTSKKFVDPLANSKLKIPKPLLDAVSGRTSEPRPDTTTPASVSTAEKQLEYELAKNAPEGYLDYCDTEETKETTGQELRDAKFDASFPVSVPKPKKEPPSAEMKQPDKKVEALKTAMRNSTLSKPRPTPSQRNLSQTMPARNPLSPDAHSTSTHIMQPAQPPATTASVQPSTAPKSTTSRLAAWFGWGSSSAEPATTTATETTVKTTAAVQTPELEDTDSNLPLAYFPSPHAEYHDQAGLALPNTVDFPSSGVLNSSNTPVVVEVVKPKEVFVVPSAQDWVADFGDFQDAQSSTENVSSVSNNSSTVKSRAHPPERPPPRQKPKVIRIAPPKPKLNLERYIITPASSIVSPQKLTPETPPSTDQPKTSKTVAKSPPEISAHHTTASSNPDSTAPVSDHEVDTEVGANEKPTDNAPQEQLKSPSLEQPHQSACSSQQSEIEVDSEVAVHPQESTSSDISQTPLPGAEVVVHGAGEVECDTKESQQEFDSTQPKFCCSTTPEASGTNLPELSCHHTTPHQSVKLSNWKSTAKDTLITLIKLERFEDAIVCMKYIQDEISLSEKESEYKSAKLEDRLEDALSLRPEIQALRQALESPVSKIKEWSQLDIDQITLEPASLSTLLSSKFFGTQDIEKSVEQSHQVLEQLSDYCLQCTSLLHTISCNYIRQELFSSVPLSSHVKNYSPEEFGSQFLCAVSKLEAIFASLVVSTPEGLSQSGIEVDQNQCDQDVEPEKPETNSIPDKSTLYQLEMTAKSCKEQLEQCLAKLEETCKVFKKRKLDIVKALPEQLWIQVFTWVHIVHSVHQRVDCCVARWPEANMYNDGALAATLVSCTDLWDEFILLCSKYDLVEIMDRICGAGTSEDADTECLCHHNFPPPESAATPTETPTPTPAATTLTPPQPPTCPVCMLPLPSTPLASLCITSPSTNTGMVVDGGSVTMGGIATNTNAGSTPTQTSTSEPVPVGVGVDVPAASNSVAMAPPIAPTHAQPHTSTTVAPISTSSGGKGGRSRAGASAGTCCIQRCFDKAAYPLSTIDGTFMIKGCMRRELPQTCHVESQIWAGLYANAISWREKRWTAPGTRFRTDVIHRQLCAEHYASFTKKKQTSITSILPGNDTSTPSNTQPSSNRPGVCYTSIPPTQAQLSPQPPDVTADDWEERGLPLPEDLALDSSSHSSASVQSPLCNLAPTPPLPKRPRTVRSCLFGNCVSADRNLHLTRPFFVHVCHDHLSHVEGLLFQCVQSRKLCTENCISTVSNDTSATPNTSSLTSSLDAPSQNISGSAASVVPPPNGAEAMSGATTLDDCRTTRPVSGAVTNSKVPHYKDTVCAICLGYSAIHTGAAQELIACTNPQCPFVFCHYCIDNLTRPNVAQPIFDVQNFDQLRISQGWRCWVCLECERSGKLRDRETVIEAVNQKLAAGVKELKIKYKSTRGNNKKTRSKGGVQHSILSASDSDNVPTKKRNKKEDTEGPFPAGSSSKTDKKSSKHHLHKSQNSSFHPIKPDNFPLQEAPQGVTTVPNTSQSIIGLPLPPSQPLEVPDVNSINDLVTAESEALSTVEIPPQERQLLGELTSFLTLSDIENILSGDPELCVEMKQLAQLISRSITAMRSPEDTQSAGTIQALKIKYFIIDRLLDHRITENHKIRQSIAELQAIEKENIVSPSAPFDDSKEETAISTLREREQIISRNLGVIREKIAEEKAKSKEMHMLKKKMDQKEENKSTLDAFALLYKFIGDLEVLQSYQLNLAAIEADLKTSGAVPKNSLENSVPPTVALYHLHCLHHKVPLHHFEQPARLESAISAVNRLHMQYPHLLEIVSNPPEVPTKCLHAVHDISYIDELMATLPKHELDEPSAVLGTAKHAELRIAQNSASAAAANSNPTTNAASPTGTTSATSTSTASSPPTNSNGGGEDDAGLEGSIDTFVSAGTARAALRAAGAVCEAVNLVVTQKKYKRAFCAVRPPGHHVGRCGRTSAVTSQGFCILNNVAIGARYAVDEAGLAKVAVIDLDVHHGNGTEELLQNDNHFFFCSVHVYDNKKWFYPGTGGGSGSTNFDANDDGPVVDAPNVLNVPLKRFCASTTFLDAFCGIVLPALENFAPNLIIVSLGFDGHKDDPTRGMKLSPADYHTVTCHLMKLAAKHCEGRLITVLEGGYDTSVKTNALYTSIQAHLQALMELDL
ncbi:hdaD, histone deacetylase family protein [Pelomyxa schiedti]|nr:hdaD, histone deacetylase family protein [Pelomyxa schiedti]